MSNLFSLADYLGRLAHFEGQSPAALGDSVLWVLPSQAFRDLILRDGVFAMRVIQVLSGRVRGLVRQIEDLTLYSVVVRVARLLLKQVKTRR